MVGRFVGLFVFAVLDLAIELQWLEFIGRIIFQEDFSLIYWWFFPWFWLCPKLVLVIDISLIIPGRAWNRIS